MGMICLLLAACRGGWSPAVEGQSQESLSLLMPREIRIVEPFTRWGDFDGNPGIDGIDVYVQPVNAFGDPIRMTGTLLVELYAFRPASADRKGMRKELWELNLLTEGDQKERWNRATQMYEFRLELSAESRSASPGDKLVLVVTHNSPLGEHRGDEMVLAIPLAGDMLSRRR